MRVDTTTVPANMEKECREVGVRFAREEFANFEEMGRARCEWTRGTFEADVLPDGWPKLESVDYDAQEKLYITCEQIMDDAAAAEWERLWDELPAKREEEGEDEDNRKRNSGNGQVFIDTHFGRNSSRNRYILKIRGSKQ